MSTSRRWRLTWTGEAMGSDLRRLKGHETRRRSARYATHESAAEAARFLVEYGKCVGEPCVEEVTAS